MEKGSKKYVIRESELKEIIKEMILMEAANNPDYSSWFIQGQPQKGLTLGDYGNTALNTLKGLWKWITPNSWRRNADGNSGMDATGNGQGAGQYDGAMGATQAGVGGYGALRGLGNRVFGAKSNADAHDTLDVNAAANWLRSNANPRPTKWCARYVKKALNYGGLNLPYGMPAPSAAYYDNVLPANGWTEIPRAQAGQVGDVCVIAPYKGHPYGHISMCLGNGVWASDFIQSSMHGLRDTPPANNISVYRYQNIV